MRRAVHSLAREALVAYARTPRAQWILNWPGQLVLNCSQVRACCVCVCVRCTRVSGQATLATSTFFYCRAHTQVFWTREVTEAIQSGGAKGLSAYAQK
jgi:dynein heavy chain